MKHAVTLWVKKWEKVNTLGFKNLLSVISWLL